MEEQLKKEADKFNKDEKTAVIDGKSKQILDLDDILNGTSDVASRLRNLKKFGVTNEQIGQFLEVFGNVARQDEEGDVLLELEKVFNLFVDKISQAPNGVVINPNTGEIDEELSRIQCEKLRLNYGEYERLPIKQKQNEFEKLLNVIIKKDIETVSREYDIKYILFSNKSLKMNTSNIIWNDKSLNDDENSSEMFNVPEELKNKRKDIIKKIKAQDPLKIKLYSIEMELDASRGTPNYDIAFKKLEKFLKQHSELRQEANNIRDKNGKLDPKVSEDVEKYRNNCINLMLINKLSEYSGKDLSLLDESERKQLLILALAGVNAIKESRVNNTVETGKEITRLSWNIIRKLGPDYEKSRKPGDLFELCAKELGLNKLEKKDFLVLIKVSKDIIESSFDISKYLDEKIGNRKIADQEMKEYCEHEGQTLFTGQMNTLDDIDKLDFQTAIEEKKNSDVLNYFIDSQIEFTDTDEKEFDELYKKCTDIAWIDNRNKALKLSYMANLKRKKDLKELIDKEIGVEYNSGKLENIEKRIEKFENDPRNKEFLSKSRNIQIDEKAKNELEEYKKVMVESKILKGYYEDISNEKNGKSYSQLDDKHKKAYLRNTIVGLNYGEDIGNDSIVKMAQRRLERLNTENEKFITFDENGRAQINEELIFQEYSKYTTKYKFNSYDELKAFSESRKEEYMLNKLSEYAELDESEFAELKSKGRDERVAEIERIKLTKNEERRIRQEKSKQEAPGIDELSQGEEKSKETAKQEIPQSNYPVVVQKKGFLKKFAEFIKTKFGNKKMEETVKIEEGIKNDSQKDDEDKTGNQETSNKWEVSEEVKRNIAKVSAQNSIKPNEEKSAESKEESLQNREEI